MNGLALLFAALGVTPTLGTSLPPPRALPDGGGTLQLLTPGDPLVIPGQSDGDSFGVGRQLTSDGRLAAFRTVAGNLSGLELAARVGGVVASAESGVVLRFSSVADGQAGASELRTPVVSRDGSTAAYAIYVESAPVGFVQLYSDIYLVDLATGSRTRVTRDPMDPAAMGWSLNPSISANGDHVVFDSLDPLAADDPGLQDVYLWSRSSGAFTRISRSADGDAANGTSASPSISDDGNRIAFVSSATNLVPGGTASQGNQIFLHDRASGSTRLVSRSTSGAPGNASSSSPAISPDGRFVVFLSDASDLVPGDTNNVADAYLFDSQTSEVSRVSITAGGVQPNAPVQSASICDAGRKVAFVSPASNLDPMGPGIDRKVFVRDVENSQLRVVGRPASGGTVGGVFGSAVLAPDCGSVAYSTDALGLGPVDNNGFTDVFREDLGTGAVVMLSRWTGSPPATSLLGEASSTSSSISADGRLIIFDYAARNMFPGDDASKPRSVLIDRDAGTRTRINGPIVEGIERPRRQSALAAVAPTHAYVASVGASYWPIHVSSPGSADIVVTPPGVPEPEFPGGEPQISADGARALFFSQRVVSGDGSRIIYFSTVGSGVVDPLGAPPLQSRGFSPSLATGGDYATYVTTESILPEDADFGGLDAYRVDLRTRAHVLVTPEVPEDARVDATAISGDGATVAYLTNAPVAEPRLPACPGRVRTSRILVRDVASGATRCGSLNVLDPALPDSDYTFDSVTMSPNGRWLAYRGISIDFGGILRIFVTDLAAGTTYVANRSVGPVEVFGTVSVPAVSDQGEVVFWTSRPLVPYDVGRQSSDVYLFVPPVSTLFANGFETQ